MNIHFDIYGLITTTVKSLPYVSEGIPAGFPSPAADYIGDRIDLNEVLILSPGATYYARVRDYYLVEEELEQGDGIRTQAFDPSKLQDPSLIIYAPVRVLKNQTIVTNGDQTDTVYEGLEKGLTFEQSLRSREFEPDAPNYTPRISGVLQVENGTFSYAMSILKSNNGDPAQCNRYTFDYTNCVAGEGHFIHTYMHDGNPLPSFEGEPKLVEIPDDIDAFTHLLWNSLNEDNKVSLFVRYIDIESGNYETRIVNKNRK